MHYIDPEARIPSSIAKGGKPIPSNVSMPSVCNNHCIVLFCWRCFPSHCSLPLKLNPLPMSFLVVPTRLSLSGTLHQSTETSSDMSEVLSCILFLALTTTSPPYVFYDSYSTITLWHPPLMYKDSSNGMSEVLFPTLFLAVITTAAPLYSSIPHLYVTL